MGSYQWDKSKNCNGGHFRIRQSYPRKRANVPLIKFTYEEVSRHQQDTRRWRLIELTCWRWAATATISPPDLSTKPRGSKRTFAAAAGAGTEEHTWRNQRGAPHCLKDGSGTVPRWYICPCNSHLVQQGWHGGCRGRAHLVTVGTLLSAGETSVGEPFPKLVIRTTSKPKGNTCRSVLFYLQFWMC